MKTEIVDTTFHKMLLNPFDYPTDSMLVGKELDNYRLPLLFKIPGYYVCRKN